VRGPAAGRVASLAKKCSEERAAFASAGA